MPYYDYSCAQCGIKFERKLSSDDVDTPTNEPCPECQAIAIQYLPSFGGLGDPHKLGISRPPDAFMHGVIGRIKESVPNADFSKARFQPNRLI